MKEIARGAEAIIYRTRWGIVKDRIRKSYRLDILDKKLRRQRTKSEAKLLQTLMRAGVPVPKVMSAEDNKLALEFIPGERVRDVLAPEICAQIGKIVRKMHSANIIHGDLTTSNMILHEGKIYFIDFGLGAFSPKLEDKAVDIHLFKECLASSHHNIWKECWNIFVESYANKDVLKRLETVEGRGKYK